MDAELKSLIGRNTDAVIRQSSTNEQLAGVMERLEARLAVQPSAPIGDPRMIVAKLAIVAGVAAFVASCTVLAWRLM